MLVVQIYVSIILAVHIREKKMTQFNFQFVQTLFVGYSRPRAKFEDPSICRLSALRLMSDQRRNSYVLLRYLFLFIYFKQIAPEQVTHCFYD